MIPLDQLSKGPKAEAKWMISRMIALAPFEYTVENDQSFLPYALLVGNPASCCHNFSLSECQAIETLSSGRSANHFQFVSLTVTSGEVSFSAM